MSAYTRCVCCGEDADLDFAECIGCQNKKDERIAELEKKLNWKPINELPASQWGTRILVRWKDGCIYSPCIGIYHVATGSSFWTFEPNFICRQPDEYMDFPK